MERSGEILRDLERSGEIRRNLKRSRDLERAGEIWRGGEKRERRERKDQQGAILILKKCILPNSRSPAPGGRTGNITNSMLGIGLGGDVGGG